jgi:hypothetical protein
VPILLKLPVVIPVGLEHSPLQGSWQELLAQPLPVAQEVLQFPQWLESLVTLTSQPFESVPSQLP